MSKIERGFVPIDESHTDKVRFNLDLPQYLNRTKLRAHPERIESMMRLGGISHLRVETFESDRVTSSPLIIGGNSEGGTYAGKVSSSEKSKSVDLKPTNDSESPKVDATVKIDIQQLASRIAAENLRSEKVWAREIDRQVLSALRTAGSEALIKKNTRYDSFKFAHSITGAAFFTTVTNVYTENQAIDFTAYYLSLSSISNIFDRFIKKTGRYSVFIGPQVDRWAVLQARTRYGHVVKGEK